jgi:hypothetical protein
LKSSTHVLLGAKMRARPRADGSAVQERWSAPNRVICTTGRKGLQASWAAEDPPCLMQVETASQGGGKAPDPFPTVDATESVVGPYGLVANQRRANFGTQWRPFNGFRLRPRKWANESEQIGPAILEVGRNGFHIVLLLVLVSSPTCEVDRHTLFRVHGLLKVNLPRSFRSRSRSSSTTPTRRSDTSQ